MTPYTHRKLLLPSNNTNIPTIQTCLYFCKTSHTSFCPSACLKICPSTCRYSFSTTFIPDSSISQPNKAHNLSPLLISMLILLASTFLLITFYVLYTKLYKNLYQNNPTNNSNPQARHRRRGSSQVRVREGDFLDEEHVNSTLAFHPIWHIPTVGLNSTVIKSIKVTTYEKGLVENDCAVCLGEYVVGDEMRILPKCNHAFHVTCIDTWLRSHVTCPLCRAPIDPSMDKGYGQTYEVFTTIIRENNNEVEENNEFPREEVVVDVNNNVDDDCSENSKVEKSEENEESSSSQRWAASLVSRSLSCSGKIFSSRQNNNRSSPNA